MIVFAIDIPRTPASVAALSRLPNGQQRQIELQPRAAERVWVWDDTSLTLKVFSKPGTYGTIARQQFERDFGERDDKDQWEQVIKASSSGKFMRRISTAKDVDEIAKQVAKLDWVELDKPAIT